MTDSPCPHKVCSPRQSCSCSPAGSTQIDRILRVVTHQHVYYGYATPAALDHNVLNYFTSFLDYLKNSRNVLALVGAGLSAGSGLTTYRDAGRFWRGYEARLLATPGYFTKYPSFSWLYHQDRRRAFLNASPNKAHIALADFATSRPRFLTISQNIDDLSQRAGHPLSTLVPIHGSLFDLKCANPQCAYRKAGDYQTPIIPGTQPHVDLTDAEIPLPDIGLEQLPHCPSCNNFLRPDIVWFGEPIPDNTLSRIDTWLAEAKVVDLLLVIGTTACITPAAECVQKARDQGARVAFFNTDRDEVSAEQLRQEDWAFVGDASVILPELLQVD